MMEVAKIQPGMTDITMAYIEYIEYIQTHADTIVVVPAWTIEMNGVPYTMSNTVFFIDDIPYTHSFEDFFAWWRYERNGVVKKEE